jgi:photosystem II stability/assembly factor-like uncharacterized protein
MISKRVLVIFIFAIFLFSSLISASVLQEQGDEKELMTSSSFAGLKLRSIGPAHRSGRISDVVKDPTDPSIWYVGVASGNVWKTINNGTTWTPIFDHYGSYSIGSLAIDPNNTNVVWVGTGENNSQRSVGYGDGIYKSLDGGKTFKNMGLKDSLTIAKILIDPRDSEVIYAASKGPLWAPGGDRGLFKSTDGGESWEPVLEISENTGISEIVFDPDNPDTIYAASYQRRRHVGIIVAGGPESRVYKTTDAGMTWKMLTNGLPGGDIGRIGLEVSPIKSNVVYALVAATDGNSGFYRSDDFGESWSKSSDYICMDPQYYMKIFADPHRFDVVYSMDVWVQVTEDGGKSFKSLNSRHKHVDNHTLLFDPIDPNYIMIGCDGGLYESWDRGDSWRFVENMPIMQFYRVGLDNDLPFYNIYGGTQDNGSLGGPSRTKTEHGIRSSDWFNTNGGDGYQVRVDPEMPNILYTESQNGGLVRFDRATGEGVDIKPQAGKGELPLKFHWDSPLIISPHSASRVYFGGNKLFRSDDRGDSWTAVSPDLTAGIDRNKREVMGRVWSIDAVWKNVFTSFFGNMLSLDESPLVEGLIYCGMDDGLVNVTEDGGQSWRKIEEFPGVPKHTYVSDLRASRTDADTVYATFNNHKEGDFTPYVLKSTDRGKSWTSIAGNVPARHVVWSVIDDHVNPDLLFLGTEFGLFFTVDGGSNWIQLKGNVPTIPFRDLEIQTRENDLVGATFGRGFYVLDDYTLLREVNADKLNNEAVLFPVKKALMYIESSPLGGGEKADLGNTFFNAPNPLYGAVFTYYLSDSMSTLKRTRRTEELARQKEGEPNYYPSWDELRDETRESAPAIIFTVKDSEGNVVRRFSGPTSKGFHRVAWDLRHGLPRPTRLSRSNSGPMAIPGQYSVSMSKLIDGKLIALGEAQEFEAVALAKATLAPESDADQLAFRQKTGRLLRSAAAAAAIIDEELNRLQYMKKSIMDAPDANPSLLEKVVDLENDLRDLDIILRGDPLPNEHYEPNIPSIISRINRVTYGFWSTSRTTGTHKEQYEIAADEYEEVYSKLNSIVEVGMKSLEKALDDAGAPWTPGRNLSEWKRER